MEKIIEQMKSLGLTEYEVKAYISLLKEYPQNGYSLSKNSGVPRSRIYEVLDGLRKKQVIFEIVKNKGFVYIPLEPKLLIKKLREHFEKTIESVNAYTTDVFENKSMDLEPKTLKGRKEILEMLKVLIGEAKHRIALSIWDEELVVLKDKIDEMKALGVLLRGVYFGYNNPYEELVSHRRIERYIAEKDERYIIVIIDDVHVVSGVISREEESSATWSNDPSIIEITDDFIAHDVMLNTYCLQLQGRDKAVYERALDEVRKEYYGFSDEEYELFPIQP